MPGARAAHTFAGMKTMHALLPTALAVLAAAAPAEAADPGGSIAYAKGGEVFLTAPDGSAATQLTSGGGFAWPSQADDGTVVAVRQTAENGRTPRRLHRMDRAGQPLNPPVETVDVENSFYVGPLAPKVSPDGRLVAYHYFYMGPDLGIGDPTVPRTSLSYSDRNTVNGEITSTLGGYFTPSWLQDGRLVAWHAKERTLHADLYNADGSVTNWFGDPAVSPLLTDGEVSRDGTRLAAIGNGELRLYDVPGGPPSQPQYRCSITGLNAPHDPTWSPDGGALAWQEADGIHVAQLGDLGGCAAAPRPLVIPGGEQPDWGVASPPAPAAGGPAQGQTPGTSGGGAKPKVTLTGLRSSVSLRTVRRKGLTMRVRCATACTVAGALTVDARTARRLGLGRKVTRLGTGKARPRAGATATLRIKLTKKAARRLVRARSIPATVKVTATDPATRVRSTSTKRIRLT